MTRTGRATSPQVTPHAWVRMDASGRIRFVSRQAEVLFGYDGGDLGGQPIETLIPRACLQDLPGALAGQLPWSPGSCEGPGSGAQRTAAGRALVPCEHQRAQSPSGWRSWPIAARHGAVNESLRRARCPTCPPHPRPSGRGPPRSATDHAWCQRRSRTSRGTKERTLAPSNVAAIRSRHSSTSPGSSRSANSSRAW